jgi:1-acyl-sn-glycerol-3-phosphate acyltransferase
MNAPLRPTPGKPPSDWATPWPQVVAAIGDCWQAHKQAELLPADRLTGWSLDDRDPEVIRQMLPCCRWLYHDYFQVRTDGWEHIPDDGQVMLIGSHNGGMAAPDTSMMTYDWWQRFGPDRLIYGLMDQRVWQAMPGVGRLAAQAGAVRAHPKMALAALDRGASVLIYPGGVRDVFRPHSLRHQVCLGENQAFIKLALQKSLPIIPTISYGAHSTLLVLADLYPWLKQLNDRGMPWLWGIDPTVFPIYLGLPWGLGSCRIFLGRCRCIRGFVHRLSSIGMGWMRRVIGLMCRLVISRCRRRCRGNSIGWWRSNPGFDRLNQPEKQAYSAGVRLRSPLDRLAQTSQSGWLSVSRWRSLPKG